MLTYTPYILLACALFIPNAKNAKYQYYLLTIAILFAVALNIVEPLAVIYLSSYVVIGYVCFRRQVHGVFSIILQITFFLFTVALLIHKVPGINNPLVIAPTQISANAVSFSKYLNFDKMWVGITLFCLLNKSYLKQTFWLKSKDILLISTVFLICFSVATLQGLVEVDLKIHQTTLIWALSNLFITCVAEEVVFRQYLQDGIKKLTSNHWLAIALSGGLFGLVHIPAGPTYAIIATILGLTYGYIYQQNRNIYQPILLHFLFNFLHFTLFTYPFMVQ